MSEPAAEAPVEGSERTDNADDRRMPFLDHLGELRDRLRNAVIAVVLALAACLPFQDPLLAILARPFITAWMNMQAKHGLGRPELIFTNPIDGFMVQLKVALVAAIFLASPALFYQAWRFIAPGLYPRERRFGLLFILFAVALFGGGAAFGYLFILPKGFEVFLGYANNSMGVFTGVFGQYFDIKLSASFALRPMITIVDIYDLTTTLLLAFGLVFELPLVLSILAMLGIVTAKQLWAWNRYAILGFAVLGAILTPGDMVFGQLGMTGALTVLYNLSILIALVVQRERKAEDEPPPDSAT